MPTDSILLSRILPATPEQIYAAWLDAAGHTAMTGSPATVEAAEVGGRFTAWDGYIDGSFVALEPGARIVQSWRSDDFPADALDSLLEVRLEPVPGGTRVTLRHGDLPEGHGPALLEGWEEFYLAPMARYFSKGTRRGVKGAGKAAKASPKPAAKVRAKPRRAGKKKAATDATRRKAAPRKAGRKAAGKAAKVSKKTAARRS
jgi:uncharacterized protein YndB with AHSA1/START domain